MAKFKTGDKVIVRDRRKGVFKGIVFGDFDTETDEWYNIMLRQPYLEGLSQWWIDGEQVPCRRGISKIELDKEANNELD